MDVFGSAPRMSVITLCAGESTSKGFRIFLNSFLKAQKKNPKLHLVLFHCYMDSNLRVKAAEHGAEVISFPHKGNDKGNKQRHWSFLEYLKKQPDRNQPVMFADARDTVFLDDPFAPLKSVEGKKHLWLSHEGVTVDECPWNRTDQERFQVALRPECRSPRGLWGLWPVINGGFVAGTVKEVQALEQKRCYLDTIHHVATDQASLIAIAAWEKQAHSTHTELGVDSGWVFHGHWFSRFPVYYDNGRLLGNQGPPYAIFHQWDRCGPTIKKQIEEEFY